MTIKKITIYKTDIPLVKPFRTALGQSGISKNIFVKIETDNSLFGIGEGSPFTPVVGETQGSSFSAASNIAMMLIGRDPCDIEGALNAMKKFTANCRTTISAFDMALYDLLGKCAGLPLYSLFAGAKRTLFTDRTVGIDKSDIMAGEAKLFQDLGFSALKIKLGTSPDGDFERMNLIRSLVGTDLTIRIDANQGWDKISAIQALEKLSELNIQYCEQPVSFWDTDSMAYISSLGIIPIMADESLFDEHDALRLIKSSACDFFNIKLAKSGGLHSALKINAVAEAAGIFCMVGCMGETRLGLTAAAHLASARPNIRFIDLDSAFMMSIDPVEGGIEYGEGGKITLPDQPGLGAVLKPDFLESLDCCVVS